MKKRVLIAAILSSIVLFAWGFVYWSYLTLVFAPWKAIPEEHEEHVVSILKASLDADGVYLYPWLASGSMDGATEEEFMRKHSDGPILQIFFRRAGIPPERLWVSLVVGFGHMFVSSLLLATALAFQVNHLRRFSQRLLFVVFLGIFTSWWTHIANVNWFHHPFDYALFFTVYDVTSLSLAGLALAAVVRPMPEATLGRRSEEGASP